MDMESEQNEKPSYRGDTRQLVSETSRPLNTEEGIIFDCPWTDCVLERESDGVSSVIIQREDREVEFNRLTICESEQSIVYSGTDGQYSDIAAMSDFSDDEDETHEEFRPGPRTGSDRDGTIEEESSLCDRPITNTVTICESEHSIVYSGTDDRNSDIAAMSDFSDDEDEAQEEFRPGPRTGSDRDGSIEEDSSLCDRPITNTVTAGDGRDSLDPNDTEYWTKFRRLTRRAFLLDDDCLSDSNYPNAVKDVVRRSRLTIMAFEQRTDGGTPGCSDWEDIMESDESEGGGDSEVRVNRPYEMRTYTPPPPLRKKRGRRYASLRKCETDVDDYFVDTSDEERWHYCTDRRRNDDEDTSSQSMSTGLTECGISVGDDSDDDFFTIMSGLFRKTRLYQGRQLVMLTGQLETGPITVDIVRSLKVKMTLQAMKILVRSTGRSQN